MPVFYALRAAVIGCIGFCRKCYHDSILRKALTFCAMIAGEWSPITGIKHMEETGR